jgi:hypothetical protein
LMNERKRAKDVPGEQAASARARFRARSGTESLRA